MDFFVLYLPSFYDYHEHHPKHQHKDQNMELSMCHLEKFGLLNRFRLLAHRN